MSYIAISVPRLNVFFTKVCLLEECFSVSFWNDVEQFGETAGGVRKFSNWVLLLGWWYRYDDDFLGVPDFWIIGSGYNDWIFICILFRC